MAFSSILDYSHSQEEMRNNETTSYLNTSSNQDPACCRSGRYHFLRVGYNQLGAHKACPPRRIAWDGYCCMAPGEHDDDFTGAHVSAFCRNCFPMVRGRCAFAPGFHGGPVFFDRVLWQRLALSGNDV